MFQTATIADFRTARRIQAGVVGLLVSLSVMNFFDRVIMSIAAPGMIKEFGISETAMGSVFSAFSLSYALLMIPGGHLADRYGPRLVLTAVGFGSALFTGLTALSDRLGLEAAIGILPALVVLRLGLGVCSAPIFPTFGRMVANWIPAANRALVYGLISAGATLGGAISPLLFAWMIARYGWRLSFSQVGVATAMLTLIWLWYVRDHPAEHPLIGERGSRLLLGDGNASPRERSGTTPWRILLTDSNILLLALGYFTVGYFQSILYYWTFYYFGTVRHMGRATTALGTMATFLAPMVMTPAGGWISDCLCIHYGRKVGRRIVPIVGLVSGTILLYIGTRISGTLHVVAMVSLSLGLVSAAESPFWASTIDIGGHEVGAACGILNGGGNVGGFLAPLLTPIIAAYAGWSWGLNVGCLFAAAGILVWFFIDPTRVIDETG